MNGRRIMRGVARGIFLGGHPAVLLAVVPALAIVLLAGLVGTIDGRVPRLTTTPPPTAQAAASLAPPLSFGSDSPAEPLTPSVPAVQAESESASPVATLDSGRQTHVEMAVTEPQAIGADPLAVVSTLRWFQHCSTR